MSIRLSLIIKTTSPNLKLRDGDWKRRPEILVIDL